MDDREAAIALMANMLARRDWERIREQDNFRIRAWEDMDQETRDAWAESRKEDAVRFVSFLIPTVLRTITNNWGWDGTRKSLRELADFYELGEIDDE